MRAAAMGRASSPLLGGLGEDAGPGHDSPAVHTASPGGHVISLSAGSPGAVTVGQEARTGNWLVSTITAPTYQCRPGLPKWR